MHLTRNRQFLQYKYLKCVFQMEKKIWLCVFHCSDEKCLDILDFYLTTELSESLIVLKSID